MIRNHGTSYVPGQLPGSRVWAAKLPTASYSDQEDVTSTCPVEGWLVWPQDAILEDMLEHILRNPQYSNRN
jgi:hypothetical protein